jgi:hypothetical protein
VFEANFVFNSVRTHFIKCAHAPTANIGEISGNKPLNWLSSEKYEIESIKIIGTTTRKIAKPMCLFTIVIISLSVIEFIHKVLFKKESSLHAKYCRTHNAMLSEKYN